MKKLTQKEVDARLVIYDEVIDHLAGDINDTKEEKRQAEIVRKQITKISEKFHRKYFKRI